MTIQDPIVILAGLQKDGTTYELHPVSRQRLRHDYPHVRQAPSVFVGYDTQADFETLHGPMWYQIATLLAGLSAEKLREFGPVVLRIPGTDEEFKVTE